MSESLEVLAFAKVNLSLVVLGKRPDGYHELDTVFQSVDLADRLVLEPAGDLHLTVDGADLAAGEDNLVMKAARALAEEAGAAAGARIHLEKRIPLGAGLGGGSSDAAGVLRGLAALWKLDPSRLDLAAIGARIGSDVPFFFTGGRARGTGRGERIAPLPDGEPLGLLLLFPPFGLATGDVYARLRAPALTADPAVSILSGPESGPAPDRNDLEPAAESLRSELRLLRNALLDAGALTARLSGSGSTVFGVFSSAEAAERAGERLTGLPSGTRFLAVSTVSRDAYAARSAPHPGGG